MSVKSRVACPAQAERLRSGDLALISTLPDGWSCRSRRPRELPRKVLVTECSAYPYSFRPPPRAASNAPPSAGEKAPNTPISVLVTGSSQPGAPAGVNAPLSPGASSGWASSAGELSAAAFSAARTTSSIWPSRTPARETTPALIPSRPCAIAMTVSCRDRDTPFVVRVLPAQRRFAEDVSSARTTHSSHCAAASARSTDSCGVMRSPPRCSGSALPAAGRTGSRG
jgi:hypothetical protein